MTAADPRLHNPWVPTLRLDQSLQGAKRLAGALVHLGGEFAVRRAVPGDDHHLAGPFHVYCSKLLCISGL